MMGWAEEGACKSTLKASRRASNRCCWGEGKCLVKLVVVMLCAEVIAPLKPLRAGATESAVGACGAALGEGAPRPGDPSLDGEWGRAARRGGSPVAGHRNLVIEPEELPAPRMAAVERRTLERVGKTR